MLRGVLEASSSLTREEMGSESRVESVYSPRTSVLQGQKLRGDDQVLHIVHDSGY